MADSSPALSPSAQSFHEIAVVLVEPEQAANVGFVARTMACYQITDLRIVGSAAIASADAARKTAKAAEHVLSAARYYETLQDAIADCIFAFGFTRRARAPGQAIQDLSDIVRIWKAGESGEDAHPQKTALVFGCESQGLSRSDTLAVSHLARIPMPEEKISLNLSHAVAIALYAFHASTGSPGEGDGPSGTGVVTTLDEAERVYAQWVSMLASKGHFRPAKADAQKENLRLLWQRLRPTRKELEFLAGIVRRLEA